MWLNCEWKARKGVCHVDNVCFTNFYSCWYSNYVHAYISCRCTYIAHICHTVNFSSIVIKLSDSTYRILIAGRQRYCVNVKNLLVYDFCYRWILNRPLFGINMQLRWSVLINTTSQFSRLHLIRCVLVLQFFWVPKLLYILYIMGSYFLISLQKVIPNVIL